MFVGCQVFEFLDQRTASMKMVLGWLPSGGEVFSRQLRLGWFRSPNISTCEKPRLFAFFSVPFIFASFTVW